MSPSPARPWSLDQLNQVGSAYGYRYSSLSGTRSHGGTVMSGHYDRIQLRPGATLAMSQVRCDRGYRALSRARQLNVMLLLQGEVCVHSEHGPEIRLSAGSWAAVASDAGHAAMCDHAAGQDLVTLSLRVDGSEAADPAIAAALAPHWQEAQPRLHHGTAPAWLRQAAQAALQLQRNDSNGLADVQAQGAGLMLLSHALAAADAASQQVSATLGGASAREHRLIDRACQLLRDEPAREHRLAELAAAACMSQSVFVTRFRQLHGCTPFAWLQQLRMERACALLEQGHSVQEAAIAAGYRHPTNFATAFRRVHGVAPSAHRAVAAGSTSSHAR